MEQNTNWCQSVTGVVIKDGKVLLARHTYGSGAGKLIVPGGYVEFGESPQDALKREFMEETKVAVEPKNIIGIRFNNHDWYIDHDENSEVLWLVVEEALVREDVPDLTKQLIRCALKQENGLKPIPYVGNPKNSKGYLYGI